MKKRSITVLFACFISFIGFSQTIVTTDVQMRNVVLEEYTGIHCGYCPDGHARAEELKTNNPGRIELLNIHAGAFAVPAAGEPEFRTIFGDSLVALAGVSGYPSGTVNRHIFPAVDATKTALSRSAWAAVAPEILAKPSPVNIGFNSTFDSASRQLTIVVEAYYSMNSPESSNYINIALLENHVIGYQSDYANGTHTDYDHKHILRHLITGQWGAKITQTSKGSLYTNTFNYVVPAEWVASNCDVMVYISESKQEVYTGFTAPADGGSVDGTTALFIGDLEQAGVAFVKGTEGAKTSFDLDAYSALTGTSDFKFVLTNDAPHGWISSFTIDGTDYSDSTIISLTDAQAKTITINVTPDVAAAISTFTLSMKSMANPLIEERIQKVYVISGVTDLVLNNSAAWGNGDEVRAKDFDNGIKDGLTYAGNSSFASAESEVIKLISSADVLNEVLNIYYNVGWSFPSMNDDLCNFFALFLDRGGNLFVSGQDIAWDNFDAGGYGTATTSSFVTNYLHAGYVIDGDQSHSQLTANGDDGIFKAVNSSAIENKYGVNPDNGQPYFYPDQLSVGSQGQSVFYYNGNTSKTAVVRSRVEDYKTLFMGVSLEMIADVAVQKEIMKLTYDWFSGLLSNEEFDSKMLAISANYPNPANQYTMIPIHGQKKGQVEIYDLGGKIIQKLSYAKGTKELKLNTSDMQDGLYVYKIVEDGKIVKSLLFQIIH